MGKYSVGAKVRDPDGDIGEIIGKPYKGTRTVRVTGGKYDGVVVDYRKSRLEVVADPAPASASAELFRKEYAVGDRVRFTVDNPNGGSAYGSAGEEYTVTRAPKAGFGRYGPQLEIDHPGHGFKPSVPVYAVEPVVAAATTKWVPKVGDRVRVIDPTLLRYDTPIGAEGVVTKVGQGDHFDIDLTHPTDGVINQWVSARDVEPVPPLTISAGRFYRTRDGRKVGPIVVAQGDGEPWPTKTADGELWFRANGYSCPGSIHLHRDEDDLVAEWVEPEPEPVAVAEATATLTLESGGTYLGESGTAYAVETNPDNEYWTFKTAGLAHSHDDVRFWKANGEAYNPDNWNPDAAVGDRLISLVSPPAKFKVGDRVRLVESGVYNGNGQYGGTGETGTLLTFDSDDDTWRVDFDRSGLWWAEVGNLELVTLSTGDTVTFTDPPRVTSIDGQFARVQIGAGNYSLPASALRAA